MVTIPYVQAIVGALQLRVGSFVIDMNLQSGGRHYVINY